MKRYTLLLMLVVSGLAFAGDKGPTGLYRPTLSTFSNSYLKKVKLEVATMSEVIQYVGMPDKTMKVGDDEYLTYDIATQRGATIQYTFIIRNGVVWDVTYLNSGNFFGYTARDSAREKQGLSGK